jgi:hypothetical protein
MFLKILGIASVVAVTILATGLLLSGLSLAQFGDLSLFDAIYDNSTLAF